MVLRLIEEAHPLDEIVFYDTGMEFHAIYKNWNKLKRYAEARGIKCTTLKPECEFLYDMLKREVKNRDGSGVHYGYSWCGGVCRWGTREKQHTIDSYAKQKPNAVRYIGIAYDEPERLKKEYKNSVIFPLYKWKMTEADCLAFCRKRGVNWNEESPTTATGYIDLYDILDRVSCWCCRNKNLWELRNIWYFLPEYWEHLKGLQSQIQRPFKKEYSIFDLEKKFLSGYIPKHRKKRDWEERKC